MINKNLKRDKIIDGPKQSTITEKKYTHFSAFNIKQIKSAKNTFDKNRPILNKFTRGDLQKEREKENDNNVRDEKYKDSTYNKKIRQANEKERELKYKNINNIINKDFSNKRSREAIYLNSFLSNNIANYNDNERQIHDNKNNDIVSEPPQNSKREEKVLSSEKYANKNINVKNISKLLSYNAKAKNINRSSKINDNSNYNINNKKTDNHKKIIEKKNMYINHDNINVNKIGIKNSDNKNINNNNNTEDTINVKSISIKRKYNSPKVNKIENGNTNLKQINEENNNNNNNELSTRYISRYIYHKNNKLLKNMKEKPTLASTENNNNEEKNIKDNESEKSSHATSGNKLLSWNIRPKQSFQFLVHQVSKNRDLSNSFHKYYESNQLKSRGASRARSDLNDSSINNADEQNNVKHKFRNLSLLKTNRFNNEDSFSSFNANNIKENKFNSFTERKNGAHFFNNNNINNIKVINNEINNRNSNSKMGNNNNSIITNNIINNNIYNTTLNFYEISNVFKKTKGNSNKNYIESDTIIYENKPNMNTINEHMNLNKNNKNLSNISNDYSNNQKDQNNFIVVTPSSTSSTYMPFINLDAIFTLETKLKSILDKINKYQACDKECLDYISYFFNNTFYEEETKIFKHKHNKKNFSYNMKIELLCFFLCYDISFSIHFNQAAILLKSIFNIIHSNFLSFIYYIISLYQLNNNMDEKNAKIVKNLQIIIEQDLKINLEKQDLNEYNILQIITNNSKNINNYYKMIIDNLYGQNYVNDDNNIKFPQCLNNQSKIISQLKKNKLDYIISAFFFDAYRLLTNYDFNDLNNFFEIFLKRKKNIVSEANDYNEEKYKSNEKNNFFEHTNEQNTDSQNKIEKYLLPRMKRIYKYTLVLDLDETLISIKRDSKNNIKMNKNNLIPLILRPGLIDFLHKMKQIFELILFSSGTSEYVTPIIKLIEKKEKFFEHILYRQHVTYEENGNFFKNLNLLNRNVKNILIVDNVFENFKNHKSNGICIKPFYGDSLNDKNTLKVLGNILYKVRYDADTTGDIRVSLAKEKKTGIYSQIANNL